MKSFEYVIEKIPTMSRDEMAKYLANAERMVKTNPNAQAVIDALKAESVTVSTNQELKALAEEFYSTLGGYDFTNNKDKNGVKAGGAMLSGEYKNNWYITYKASKVDKISFDLYQDHDGINTVVITKGVGQLAEDLMSELLSEESLRTAQKLYISELNNIVNH